MAPMSFPDPPLDPPDYNLCPECRCDMSEMSDEEVVDHIMGCDPAAEKAERAYDEKHEEGRMEYLDGR